MTDHKNQAPPVGSPSIIISERLARVETKIEAMQDKLDTGLRSIHDCVGRVGLKVDDMASKSDAALNGSPGDPGLKIKVALLESGSERRRWFNRLVIGSIVTLAGSGIYAAIT